MVRLFTDDRMLDHEPPIFNPERPERLRTILRHLDRRGLRDLCLVGHVREATETELLRAHSPFHLARLAKCEANGGGRIEPDTWVGRGSNLAARLAAGAVIEAVRSVLTGHSRAAFCAVRPPGHHARPDQAMGFCLLGNAALGAHEALQEHDVNRVLIVDWDVHHGNGTQEMFYQDGRVGFLSLHRHPFYPGSGLASQTGSGRGLGMIRNLPTLHGTPRSEIVATFRKAVEDMADSVRPELVIISAGFDGHARDPIGDLGLEDEDYVEFTKIVRGVAETHAGGRIVSVLEGGYNWPVLAKNVADHILSLGADPDDHSSWTDLI